MRYIAVFLLLANIGYFGWNYLQPKSNVIPQAAQAKPLLVSGLMLASEYQPPEPDPTCSMVTGFSTVDDANSFIVLAESLLVSARLTLSGDPLPAQYRLYLPPLSSREQATSTLDALSARIKEAGLEVETYLITRGVLENGIALGVFSDIAEAERVTNQLEALNYGAEIEEIPQSSGDIRVELEPNDSVKIENPRWLELTADRPSLTRTENLCETIAQGTQFP